MSVARGMLGLLVTGALACGSRASLVVQPLSADSALEDGGAASDDAAVATDAPDEDSTTGSNDASTDVSRDQGGTVRDAAATDGPVDGAALRFDGVRAYVTLPSGAGGASETAFSCELWFRTTAATGMLFEVYASAPVGADRSIYLRNGQVCFYVYTPAYSELCTASGFNDGAWHNVAGTLGPGGQRLYVDGALLRTASTVTASAFGWDTGFRLGYGYIGPSGPLTFYAGDIDDVRLWNVERTQQELAVSRARAIDPRTSGLQGYWKLDESGSTAIAPDSVTAAHNGTLNGFSFNPSPWIAPGAF